MKVLVVGGGGREHALCWAIAASPLVERLWCAPGNAGTREMAESVPLAADDLDGLLAFSETHQPDLVVVGPEAPLVLGLVDRLQERGIRAFGPCAAAAILEGSKGFMKDFCGRHGIPTAAYRRFSDPEAARKFIEITGTPIVVKADGLAAGKGVVICGTAEQANAAVEAMLTSRRFGDAGASIVIEEYLEGEEVSFFALTDGEHVLPFASARDYKRAGDGDTGSNTGGMGACSPAPSFGEDLEAEIMETVIRPTVDGMREEGRSYQGILYAGLMLTPEGPRLLEYNVRFGDPECQVLMARLMSDPVPAFAAACDGELRDFCLRWHDDVALTVVMAAKGYPGAYEKGSVISGLEAAGDVDGVILFHAGTAAGEDGRIVATGGRVLNVTAYAPTLPAARHLAYEAVDRVDWPGGFCRRDIGATATSAVPRTG